MIRVAVVAASPVARAGWKSLLATPDVQFAGSFASIDELLSDHQDDQPGDVLVIDASAQRGDAILETLAASEITSDIPVIILSDSPRPEWAGDALRTGVRAVLPADLPAGQLLAAIQSVAAGLVVLPQEGLASLLPVPSPASAPPSELPEPLTRREREVLQMLASGLGNKQIAARLSISEHTAKFHVASILGKLGVSSRTEAVSQGIRRGLVLL
jgi:two-component system, NarL family, response regulator YdfI